jgi:hypothetical protein
VPIYHRTSDSPCALPPAAGDCSFTNEPSDCQSDGECTSGTNGRCIGSMGGPAICFCTYDTCMHDTDCAADQACACHGTAYAGNAGNACVPGDCRVDTDCGAGGYCSPTMTCDFLNGYYCHTPNDLCIDQADCTTAELPVCDYSTKDLRWECIGPTACPLIAR